MNGYERLIYTKESHMHSRPSESESPMQKPYFSHIYESFFLWLGSALEQQASASRAGSPYTRINTYSEKISGSEKSIR